MNLKRYKTAIILGTSVLMFSFAITGCNTTKEKPAETKIETNKSKIVVDDKMSPGDALDKTLYQLINGEEKIEGIQGWSLHLEDDTYEIYLTLEPSKEFSVEQVNIIRNNISDNLKVLDDTKKIDLNFNDVITYHFKEKKWDKDAELITIPNNNNTEKESKGE